MFRLSSDFNKHILDDAIMSLFSNAFRSLNISLDDLKYEYRMLGLPELSSFEREAIASRDGYKFDKKEESNFSIANPFGHLLYKGRPIILYIRDQFLSLENYEKKKYNPFHICNCEAIRKARMQNRLTGRYVITYNTSGIFNINISVIENYDQKRIIYNDIETQTVRLKVCETCLHELGWGNFNKYIGDTDEWWKGGDERKRKEIVRDFDIRQFFAECTSDILSYEDFSDLDFASSATQKKRTLPTEIKLWLKKSSAYRCEVCHKIFPENMLQIHHLDHNEGNNARKNLVVVCENCHRGIHLREDTSDGIRNFAKELRANDVSSKPSGTTNDDSKLEKEINAKRKADALVNLADKYFNGDYGTIDIQKAIDLYLRAAEAGNVEAVYKLGKARAARKDYDTAAEYYRKAAKLGFAEAQYQLAKCYREGEGTIQSSKEYAHWIREAALQGHTEAEYEYGLYFRQKNFNVKAFNFFTKAAENKHIGAIYELGVCCYYGIGTEKDIPKALTYYQEAAVHNHEEALKKLAEHYERGL